MFLIAFKGREREMQKREKKIRIRVSKELLPLLNLQNAFLRRKPRARGKRKKNNHGIGIRKEGGGKEERGNVKNVPEMPQ